MSRYLRRQEAELEEHDISKELFLGIMMLMLSLGIMILNVTQPVWRVHRQDPQPGDMVVLYTSDSMGLSTRYVYESIQPCDLLYQVMLTFEVEPI